MQLLDDKIEPQVSVIILSYNSRKLYSALASVIDQVYSNIEVIIADDASEEFDEQKIEEIISRKKENIKNVIVSRNIENIGTVKNYNNAIKLSSGKYIVNLASDDRFIDEMIISEIVKKFERLNSDILIAKTMQFGNNIDINQNKKVKYFKHLKHKKMKKAFNLLARGNCLSGACTYYKKAYFDNHGLFNENYILIEDWSNILRATREGFRVDFLDYECILYGLGGVSTVKNKSSVYINDYINIIDNEIIPYKKSLSLFTYRYNLFMKQYLLPISNMKKTILYIKYIDVVLFKMIMRTV